MSNTRGKYRSYDARQLINAAKLVREENISVYQASKRFGVPWSSLKDFLAREQDNYENLPKLGRPYALTTDMEIKLYTYIIEMQELGFGLTVSMVRKVAHRLATLGGRENFMNAHNDNASKWWWTNFKKRYNLALRTPENLAAYRASMANKEIISDFYIKLKSLLEKLKIDGMSDRLWNCDETGLSYVVKPQKVITAIGKRYVYKRTYAERGETHTLLACACANGTWIPPMTIFKGVRWNENLTSDCLPNALVKLSPKGWITSEIFLEWFSFFINSIPPDRPVVLIMDSHASHINPDIITLAKENEIYILTLPSHTTHLLQPLDVGVYKSLKSHWSGRINDYMREHPNEKPNRTNFHFILTS